MMEKISQKEAIRTTTMFLMDDGIENKFDDLIQERVKCYQNAMIGIGTSEGLHNFIRNNKDAIEMLETALGITGERMKRVVTMIRVSKGYTFETEWSERKLQFELAQNEQLLDEYCDLFLRGKNLTQYQKLIPKFILDDFCIDENIINRVTNYDVLRKLFKTKNDTSYTSQFSTAYTNAVKEKLQNIATETGLLFKIGIIDGVGDDLTYITNGAKTIIFTYNYTLTTGPNQTKHSKTCAKVYQAIRKRDDIILINMLDGAGWIGRSSDFKKIYHDCNYYANLNVIDTVKDVIIEFLNN